MLIGWLVICKVNIETPCFIIARYAYDHVIHVCLINGIVVLAAIGWSGTSKLLEKYWEKWPVPGRPIFRPVEFNDHEV